MRPLRRFDLTGVRFAAAGLLVLVATGCTAASTAAVSLQADTTTGSLPVAAAGTVPTAGNPNGHVTVPKAGRAVDTSRPNHVIGNGKPASCTSAAVIKAVAAGGIIRFNCGKKPVTIKMNAAASVPKTRHLVVLDGSGLVTLSGQGKHRILYSDTCAGTWSTNDCVNQPYPQIVVQNLTFTGGYAKAHQAMCTDNTPKCWYGGVTGGGAIYVEGGQFKAVNSRFVSNACYSFGPDLGGGAIRALAQYQGRPVYITSDTFTGGRCSNGAALSSIKVQWDVYNSVFTGNKALGWGANPAGAGTPGGGSGGAIYTDGDDYSLLIAGTIMKSNSAREGGGAIFFVVDDGPGTLNINYSTLKGNPSAEFQDAPGIFDSVDGTDVQPVLSHSSVS